MKYVLIIVGAIFLLVVLSLGYLSLQRTQNTEVGSTTDTVTLSDYADSGTTVSFMTEGSVNGNETHRSIRITVSKDSRLVEILGGYNYTLLKSRHYGNTPEAYKPFLAALQGAGFVKEKRNPRVSNPDGKCPLGLKYFFSSTGIPDVPESLWSASCSAGSYGGGYMGTFDGRISTIQQLFQDQIPDYSQITSSVTLY